MELWEGRLEHLLQINGKWPWFVGGLEFEVNKWTFILGRGFLMYHVTPGEGQGKVTFNLCLLVGRCASALLINHRLAAIPEIPEVCGWHFFSALSRLVSSGSCLRTLSLQGSPGRAAQVSTGRTSEPGYGGSPR